MKLKILLWVGVLTAVAAITFVAYRLHVTKRERCEGEVYKEVLSQCMRDCAGTSLEKLGGGCSHVCAGVPDDFDERVELACGHL